MSMQDPLSLAFRALERSVENETLCFEARVCGKPFLPKHRDESHRVFRRHCNDMDLCLYPSLETNGPVLKHFCWMAAPSTDSHMSVILLQYEKGQPEYPPTLVERSKTLGLFHEHVLPLLSFPFRVMPLNNIGTARTFFRVPFLVLSVYAVFASQRIVEIVDQQPNPDKFDSELFLQQCRLPKAAWPDDFIYCKTVLIPSGENEQQQGKAAVESLQKDLQRHGVPLFHSYHAIVAPAELPSTRHPDTWQLAALRLVSMQFQREWANRDHELEASRNAERKRRQGLEMVAHEIKNALEQSRWYPLLMDLQSKRLAYDDPRTQDRIERCLALLLWPQSLTAAIRSLAKADLGSSLRKLWLIRPDVRILQSDQIMPVYNETVRYLINFATWNASHNLKSIRIVEIKTVDYATVSLSTAIGGGYIATHEPFDPFRLAFPPLRQDGNDEFVPTFVFSSLIVEPIRNALRYLGKLRTILGPRAFLGWSVKACNNSICVDVINPILPNTELPKMGSTELLSRLAKSLGIGELLGPTTITDADNKPFSLATIMLTPHLLFDRPGADI